MTIKKKLHKLYGKILWRIEESRRILTIGVLLLTMIGVWLPHINKELADLGIHISSWVLFGILLILNAIGVLIVGEILNKLKLYESDWDTRIDKNPYQNWKIDPLWEKLHSNRLKFYKSIYSFMQENNVSKKTKKEAKEAIDELEKWIKMRDVRC